MVQKKKKSKKSIYDHYPLYYMPIRYLILLGAMLSLPLIYLIFTPLTVYPVSILLDIFTDISMSGTLILINGALLIEIVPACVAGSAYLLVLLLNLSLPMNTRTRVLSITFSWGSLLIVNILRIFFLSLLALQSPDLFDFTHDIFWYGVSIVFVVLVWFAVVFMFGIKETPVFSDLSYLMKESFSKKKK